MASTPQSLPGSGLQREYTASQVTARVDDSTGEDHEKLGHTRESWELHRRPQGNFQRDTDHLA